MNPNQPKPSLKTPEAEVKIDIPLIKNLLYSQHQDLAHLPLEFMGAGWDNEMYRLGDDYIIRIPRRQIAVELIENEQKWLNSISKRIDSNIQIPEHIRIGQPEHGYPWTWSVLPWIKGNMAIEGYPASDQVKPLVQFLQQLHIIDHENVAPNNSVRGVPLADRLESIESRMKELKTNTSFLSSRIEAIWETALSTSFTEEKRWIHGDLHPRNILVNDKKITAIIDWGDMTSGDIASDLACIWMLFEEQNARQEFIQLYGMDENLIKRSKGWAVMFGTIFLVTGLIDNPQNAKLGQLIFERLEEDFKH